MKNRHRSWGNSFVSQRRNLSLEDQMVELFAHSALEWRMVAAMSIAQFAAAHDHRAGRPLVPLEQVPDSIPPGLVGVYCGAYQRARELMASEVDG